MWLDSFQSLSLDDSLPNKKLNRSMSLSEIHPRKRIRVEQKLHSGASGKAVLRQYSCEELGIVPGTSSLRLSKKFVSELRVDFSNNNTYSEISKIKSYSKPPFQHHSEQNKESNDNSQKVILFPPVPSRDKDLEFLKHFVSLKDTSLGNSSESYSPEMPSRTKMTLHQEKHDKKHSKRKRLLRLMPNRFSSKSTNSVNGLLSDSKDSVNVESKSRSLLSACVFWIILPVLVIIIGTLGTQFAIHRKTCETKFDLNAMEYLLSTTIFGQEKAIRQVVSIFKDFYDSEQDGLQVIVFTGNTGVGKTFTASLLEEIFPWRFNIHHFVMPVDLVKLPSDSLYNYPYCGDHLVILDNLREEDVNDATQVVSYLKKLAMPKRVIAILIFRFHKEITDIPPQIEVMKKGSDIQSKLAQNGIKNEVVYFKDLDKKDVMQCVKEALSRHWMPISDNAVKAIMEQVDYQREGCKRIASKIAVVNDIWVRNE